MKKLIGYCGLDCEKCDTYIATQTDDDELRSKTAELWSKLNNVPITAEMMNCDGCRADGIKTGFCESMCQIRKCAASKKYETCGDCENVDSCETLKMITGHNEEAVKNLHSK